MGSLSKSNSLFLFFIFVNCSVRGQEVEGGETILHLLEGNKTHSQFDNDGTNFDIFSHLFLASSQAHRLEEDIAGDITVLAPDDNAFRRALGDLGLSTTSELETFENFIIYLMHAYRHPIDLLTRILYYHVIPREVNSTSALQMSSLVTWAEPLRITREGNALVDLNPEMPNSNVNIDRLDIQASNGVIHVIDYVLFPEVMRRIDLSELDNECITPEPILEETELDGGVGPFLNDGASVPTPIEETSFERDEPDQEMDDIPVGPIMPEETSENTSQLPASQMPSSPMTDGSISQASASQLPAPSEVDASISKVPGPQLLTSSDIGENTSQVPVTTAASPSATGQSVSQVRASQTPSPSEKGGSSSTVLGPQLPLAPSETGESTSQLVPSQEPSGTVQPPSHSEIVSQPTPSDNRLPEETTLPSQELTEESPKDTVAPVSFELDVFESPSPGDGSELETPLEENMPEVTASVGPTPFPNPSQADETESEEELIPPELPLEQVTSSNSTMNPYESPEALSNSEGPSEFQFVGLIPEATEETVLESPAELEPQLTTNPEESPEMMLDDGGSFTLPLAGTLS